MDKVASAHRSGHVLPYFRHCPYSACILKQQGDVAQNAYVLDGGHTPSYVFYFLGSILLVNIPIPYIENKLENYEKTSETMESSLNVFSPLHLFTIMLFLYLMYFYETIKEHNRYFTLMMKIFAISIFSFTAFAFLPLLANRLRLPFPHRDVVLFLQHLLHHPPEMGCDACRGAHRHW